MKLDCYVNSEYVTENSFINRDREVSELPVYENIKDKLPKPVWENHEDSILCYYKAWEIAFGNLKKATEENGFVSNFIDTAFNNNIFMWDSSFIMMFGKYAKKIFNFQKTMDNFYCKQHPDGFICRAINEDTGLDRFERFNPVSTGPNIMPWCEWEYYLINGDKERLCDVFPVLLAYYNWFKEYRTWKDGTYWSSGLGCGMDNTPRLEEGYDVKFSHGHMVWLDTCLQQVLSGQMLINMANVIGRQEDVKPVASEIERLKNYINNVLWDEKDAFYYDLWRNGQLNFVKSIGAYWALLADVVPEDRLQRFVAHLENQKEFKRPHRVPTLSADSPDYQEEGHYWRGAVWAPTNYMVLKGLYNKGYFDLAHDIALNHVSNVTQVFNNYGTLFENYAPEKTEKGEPAKANFVGWTGLSAISVLIEYVFGIVADVERGKIVWNVNLVEKHGICNYSFGDNATLDLICQERQSKEQEPVISVISDADIEVEVLWNGNKKIMKVAKNK